jgi:hypothetical protein
VLGIQESVRLLDYFEFSYFGEWEVIFDRPAERSYVAINRNMVSELPTQVYFIKPQDFHSILAEFVEFDKF